MVTESRKVEQLLRIICAVVMLSLGFAHRPVEAIAAPSAAYDEAYRLPDGGFAEICADHAGVKSSEHGRGGHSGNAVLFCEACLLASSILLPVPDDSSWLKTSSAWLENPLVHRSGLKAAASLHRANARAPPSITV